MDLKLPDPTEGVQQASHNPQDGLRCCSRVRKHSSELGRLPHSEGQSQESRRRRPAAGLPAALHPSGSAAGQQDALSYFSSGHRTLLQNWRLFLDHLCGPGPPVSQGIKAVIHGNNPSIWLAIWYVANVLKNASIWAWDLARRCCCQPHECEVPSSIPNTKTKTKKGCI